MSDQPRSHDSTRTQKVLLPKSIDGRMFSNWAKMGQGFMIQKVPTVREYHDLQPETDKFEIICQQQTLRNGGLRDSSHPSPLSLTSPNVHLPAILSNKDYPGRYEFSIYFEPRSTTRKAMPWVYQQESHKLFLQMLTVCPILLKIQGTPPLGTIIRGILTYKSPEHYKDGVIRCPYHKDACKDEHPLQDHVMRCENSATRYETCPSTGRLSLVLPLKAMNPIVGADYFLELFKFTCFNSCVGGMNKRRTDLLFRLECGGIVLGRALVEVRICASPGRDCFEKDSGSAKESDTESPTDPEPPTPTLPTTNQSRPIVLMSTREDDTLPPKKRRDCDAFEDEVIDTHGETMSVTEPEEKEENRRTKSRRRKMLYQCKWPGCGNIFSNSSRIIRHVRLSHLGPKNHDDDGYSDGEEEFYFNEIELNPDENNPRSSQGSISPPLPSSNPHCGRSTSDPSRSPKPLVSSKSTHLRQTVLTNFRKGRGHEKKCRQVYGMENKHLWCTQCRWKKACTKFVD